MTYFNKIADRLDPFNEVEDKYKKMSQSERLVEKAMLELVIVRDTVLLKLTITIPLILLLIQIIALMSGRRFDMISVLLLLVALTINYLLRKDARNTITKARFELAVLQSVIFEN